MNYHEHDQTEHPERFDDLIRERQKVILHCGFKPIDPIVLNRHFGVRKRSLAFLSSNNKPCV